MMCLQSSTNHLQLGGLFETALLIWTNQGRLKLVLDGQAMVEIAVSQDFSPACKMAKNRILFFVINYVPKAKI